MALTGSMRNLGGTFSSVSWDRLSLGRRAFQRPMVAENLSYQRFHFRILSVGHCVLRNH